MYVLSRLRSIHLVVVLCAGLACAQSPTPTPTPAAEQQAQWSAGKNQPAVEKKPILETPTMRMASAKNVIVVRTRGSAIPADVIRATVEGWGRFTSVDAPGKADLIIEVASNGDSGVQVSSSSKVSADTGKEETSTSSRKDISPTDVRMTVIDARNKRVLWTAAENVKFAMKEKGKENNLVDAAEKLASKFHERLESTAK